jgi:hypothetical protein
MHVYLFFLHDYLMCSAHGKSTHLGVCAVHAVYDTFTYGLRMFTENIIHVPFLYAAGQIQKQKLQRLFLGVWNEYTSSLSVHVDRTMIRVHS